MSASAPVIDLKAYDEHVKAFERDLEIATGLSQQLAGQRVDVRRTWSCVLFTRLCGCGMGLLKVVPRSRLSSPEASQIWDFTAVASLTRNLMECSLFFHYLCVEKLDEDEALARLHLVDLHDCSSRRKLFAGWDDAQAAAFEAQLPELQARLRGTRYFQTLDERQQRRFIGGDHAAFLTQDEIVDRMGAGRDFFRPTYRYLSAQAHTLPLGFHRMLDGSRGRGLQNDFERSRIGLALPMAGDWLRQSTRDMISLFPWAMGPVRPSRDERRHGKATRRA